MDTQKAAELREAAAKARVMLEAASEELPTKASIAYSLLAIGTVLVEVVDKIALDEMA